MQISRTMLNTKLLLQNNVSEESQAALCVLYEKLYHILEHPEDYKDVVGLVNGVEYALQLLWNFPPNSDYHKYSFQIKGCTCPLIDNLDMIGTSMRYYNASCPIHGVND